VYPNLETRRQAIVSALDNEESKFKRTIEQGLKRYHKVVSGLNVLKSTTISGEVAFDLFETYGFPLSLTVELAAEAGLNVDKDGFERAYSQHRQDSRNALLQSYKGGLADHADETTALHTASHLLQQALRRVLGTHVHQSGSNITVERLRFDFTHPQRVTPDQLQQVEQLVNEQIARQLPVTVELMPLKQATEGGALAFFGEKYGEMVKVYTIGDFSKEVCGGPHVDNTARLGHFKILKEESVGTGVRRIRAVLEPSAPPASK
jgi:alanyl-tRNA synthetase